MSKKMKVRVLKKRCKFCKGARKRILETSLKLETHLEAYGMVIE